MKGLKRHIIDFEIIPTGNPNTLVFIDSSDYFTDPEKPLLEVTLPGYSEYFLVNVAARKVNTFNSNTIGLTSALNGDKIVQLPDGIYSFRYKICPYEVAFKDKKHFRTTLLEEKIAKLYEKIEDSDCSTKEDRQLEYELVEIHCLLEGAKLVVNKNEKKAYSFYQTASKLVDKLINKLCKNCV
jgi:hypothetical protein